MVQVEGRGHVAPAHVPIRMSVGIVDDCLMEARRRNEHRGYSSSNDEWRKGLCGDAVLAIQAGLLGEYGTAYFLNERFGRVVASVDIRTLPGGDGGRDLVVFEAPLQVKTCRSQTGANLIRVRKANRQPVSFSAVAVVFCDVTDVVVRLRGWCMWRAIKDLPEVPARRGNHWNIEVDGSLLEPMSALVDALESKRLSLEAAQ